MAGEEEIDLSLLGDFVGEDAPPPAPEKKDPEPEPEPEKAEAKPDPKPTPEPESEEDEDDSSLTLDELDAKIKAAVAASKAEDDADDEEEFDDPAVAKLNADLKAERAARERAEAALAEREDQEAVARLRHSISSTVGKYKMTDAEIAATVEYMQGNEDLVNGGMGFEEAAVRRLPNLRDRIAPPKTPAVGPREEVAADGVLVAPGGSGGGAPKPFKHKAEPGFYGDLTKHILESGQAANLGRYT